MNIFNCDICSLGRLLGAVYNWRSRHPLQQRSTSPDTEMAQRPLVLPDVFTGGKNWDEWMDHFDSVAAVNGWDGEEKLKWLRVRLTGRAATTFRRLSEATRADFTAATTALRERFEPESKKELYMAEMQTRSRRATD